MDFITPSWQGAHCQPCRLYNVDLAYRMHPLGSLSRTMAYLTSTRLHRESPHNLLHPLADDISHEGNGVNPHAGTTQSVTGDPSLTYNEAYVCSLAVERELSGHDGCVNSLALNATGEFLLSGSDDLSLCLYETCEWTMRQRYRTMHRSNIFHAVFVPGNEGRVLSCALDGRTILTDLETSQPYYKCRYLSTASSLATSPWWPHTAYVAYANGLIARVDTRIRLFEDEQISVGNPCLQEVKQVRVLATHERWPFLFASGTNSSKIFLHDVRMDSLGAFAAISIPSVRSCDGVGGLAFSKSGNWMAVNYRRHDLFAFPWLDTFHSTRMPESAMLDATESDGFSPLLRMGTGNLPCVPIRNPVRFRGRRNVNTMFKEVTFMEDDTIICSGGDCGNVFFWRRHDGKLLHSTLGDSDITNVVLYSENIRKLVTSGIDATAKVLESNGSLKKKQQRDASLSAPQRSHEEELHGSSLLVMMLANLVNPPRLLPSLSSAAGAESETTSTTTTDENSEEYTTGNENVFDASEANSEGNDNSNGDDENNNNVLGREEEEEGEEENDGDADRMIILDNDWSEWLRSERGSLNRFTVAQEHCAYLQFNVVLNLGEGAPLRDLIHAMREVKLLSEKASGNGAHSLAALMPLSALRTGAQNDANETEEYSEMNASTSNEGSHLTLIDGFLSLQEVNMFLSSTSWSDISNSGSDIETIPDVEGSGRGSIIGIDSDIVSNDGGIATNVNQVSRSDYIVVPELEESMQEAEGEEQEVVNRTGGENPGAIRLGMPGHLTRDSLFHNMCSVFLLLKHELYVAFRCWTIPNMGQVQIPQWDRCMWGLAANTQVSENTSLLPVFLNEYGGNGDRVPSVRPNRFDIVRMTVTPTGNEALNVAGGVDAPPIIPTEEEEVGEGNFGRYRVRCLLQIMDIISQRKEFLCETTEHRRRYWMFRCVVELCYAYYFMAIGETVEAIDRVKRLDRYAEYRCITALGSVNDAYLLRHQNLNWWRRRRQLPLMNDDDVPLMTEMPRVLDAVAFPPILVPLALQIRILVMSRSEEAMTMAFAEGVETEEVRQHRERERHISLLVEEMRKRLIGHPNRKIKRRIIRMLYNIHVTL